jgi:hypothetical protein
LFLVAGTWGGTLDKSWSSSLAWQMTHSSSSSGSSVLRDAFVHIRVWSDVTCPHKAGFGLHQQSKAW